jgi:hypothetical protein
VLVINASRFPAIMFSLVQLGTELERKEQK